jgi:hypothetical protein
VRSWGAPVLKQVSVAHVFPRGGGRVELRTEFILRFDYGFSVPWIERLEDAGLRAVAGQVESFERTTPPVPA